MIERLYCIEISVAVQCTDSNVFGQMSMPCKCGPVDMTVAEISSEAVCSV